MATGPMADVWASSSVAVRPSGIQGRGLFAIRDIPAGALVLRLGGQLVSTQELEALIAAANADGRYVDTLTVHDDVQLVLPDSSIAHFANHSCDPNLWHDGPYEVRARRDVGRDEELTVDYGTSSGASGFSMVCSCGSPLCRGTVTSDDWRLPELQRRYDGHWVPALARRIEG